MWSLIGRLKVISLFNKVKVPSHIFILMLLVALDIITYTTQVTHPVYKSSELKILTKNN